jgi:hypothetical protein
MEEKERDLGNITHGLMVLDPGTLTEEGMIDIVHFVGYWNEPTEHDIEHLSEELANDSEFGLTEISDRLVIEIAPQEVIDMFAKKKIGWSKHE